MHSAFNLALWIAGIFGLTLASIPISCLFGQYPLSIHEILSHLPAFLEGSITAPDQAAQAIILQMRLTRALAALLCGGCLALSGAMLQGALRNPLADPFTLGISAGAACGASLVITRTGSMAGISQTTAITGAALAGALLALSFSLLLGYAKGRLNRENVILGGIAVAAFLGALIALIKALNEESVTSIVFWIMGSLQGVSRQNIPVLLSALLPGACAALWGWRKLDALSLGDAEAGWLGLNAAACRFWLLLGASAMAAGCVAVAGVIGFVGLVVPHILRLILGGASGALLLASFPAGGLLLLFADCVARSILDGGQELPVGVVTALGGAPVFAWLIWKQK